MQCYQTSFSACVGQTDTENIIGLGTYQYCVDHNEFEKSLRLLVFLFTDYIFVIIFFRVIKE